MSFRANTAPKDALGRYTVYCRMCGYVEKVYAVADFCTNCGNIENGEGFHYSGDAGEVVSTVVVPNTAIKVVSTITRKRR